MLMVVYGDVLIMRRARREDVVDMGSIPSAAIPGAASQVKHDG